MHLFTPRGDDASGSIRSARPYPGGLKNSRFTGLIPFNKSLGK
jgi:hypothetical protein